MKNDTIEFASVEAVGGSGRIDLYADIHKALRAWMGHVLTRLGRTDADDPQDCADAMAQLNELLDVMQMHLETENTIVHPAIEARRPGTIQGIIDDHSGHEAAIRRLRELGVSMLESPPAERGMVLMYLYRALALFVAENLEHMQCEEIRNNQLLWSAYSDAELLAIHETIIQHHSPQDMARLLPWMIPAVNPASRAAMLGGMRTTAPAQVFEGVLATAKAHLQQRDWRKLARHLGLEGEPAQTALTPG